jgi:hypothetical protein
MSRWDKLLLIALPAALLLSVACRFIYHTDRDYAYWIALYGETLTWLEARCAELETPGACRTAQDRRSFLGSLESYRERVVAWWWPALVATCLAWTAALSALFAIVQRLVSRRK